jgi:ketosteroid isomerase-like protein
MDENRLSTLARGFIDAWNSQDVETVLAVYTEDVSYSDPNTHGPVQGAAALRRYLRKLFGEWRMHWSIREILPLSSQDGAAVLWRAGFQRSDGGPRVEADGMDLVLLRGGRIARNEVYFDRSVLAPLMQTSGQPASG